MMAEVTFECSCTNCQSACRNKPGWFLPGEMERLASNLGVSVEALFRDRLAVDWWAADNELDETFVISPAIKNIAAGKELPADPTGGCTFFQAGRCEIHLNGKPHECAALTHDGAASHLATAQAWREHQGQIRDLLGRDPEAEEYTIFDLMSSFYR